MVEDGRTGLLFRPGDADELAGALARLIENDSLRAQLAAAGAAFVRDRLSLSAAARRMGEIYSAFLP
jgi:glycosyltransferase involved in cell wall biosynthesis